MCPENEIVVKNGKGKEKTIRFSVWNDGKYFYLYDVQIGKRSLGNQWIRKFEISGPNRDSLVFNVTKDHYFEHWIKNIIRKYFPKFGEYIVIKDRLRCVYNGGEKFNPSTIINL